jgi:uncharacterized membrane protein YdbT with pleckstrin-like domain
MGSYINNNLIRDEQLQFETKYHWVIFISLPSLLTLFIRPFILRATDEFGITNKRVIVKTGLFSRKTVEMNLNKIESVNVHQSLLSRMLDYGTITIIGTGGTREMFHQIAHPIHFRKTFQEVSG